MSPRRMSMIPPPTARATTVLLATAGLALSACGRHAYPGSSEPQPSPTPRAELMGAPDGAPPGPPQAYGPAEPGLEAQVQPATQAPSGEDPQPFGYPDSSDGHFAQGYGPSAPYSPGYGPPPPRRFAPGQCPPRAERLPTDGCMDPIPNPREGSGYRRETYRHDGYRDRGYTRPYRTHLRHHSRPVYAPQIIEEHAAPRRPHHQGLWRYEPYRPIGASHFAHHARHAALAHPAVMVHHSAAHSTGHVAQAASKPVKLAAARTFSEHANKGAISPAPSLRAASTPDKDAAQASATGPMAALSAALIPLVKARAVLRADGLKANQPGDVTLTLPPDFADGLRAAAAKNGLTAAAASANLTAALAGDGYAVTPSESRSLPLVAGQATTFKWTVTPAPGAKGPLRASVGADLLGGGVQHVDLGSVDKAAVAPFRSWTQIIGLTLLALIALVGAALFAGRRRGPATGAMKPRSNHVNGRTLDIGQDRRG